MSEQLEILQLKEMNRQLAQLNEKQSNSIKEMNQLLIDIVSKLSDIKVESTKEEAVDIISAVHSLILLRVKRAANYLYLPER